MTSDLIPMGDDRFLPTDPAMAVYTPDDLMAGLAPSGQTVALYDDDHFYMGSVLAELLVARGTRVHFITPAVKDEEAQTLFPKGFRKVKPYLRYTPQPDLEN